MGDSEVEEYLEHMVLKNNVSPRTQATALNSLSFLYKHIMGSELSLNLNFARSKRQPKLPVVMTTDEVKILMNHLNKRYYLIRIKLRRLFSYVCKILILIISAFVFGTVKEISIVL